MRGLESPSFMVEIVTESIVDKIQTVVENVISEQEDLFLVDIIKKGNDRSGKVIVLLDGDQGISIEQCAKVSREVSHFIDEEIELSEPLTLEVSSAGLDHPLKLNRQYVKNIGKMIKVTLNDQTLMEGQLKKVTESSVELEIVIDKKKKTTETKVINFEDINKTIVLVSFK
ncbi:MAG: ribosome maturation factor RimP [Reichenbachiella sp.]|uniref:ribosome maturation factor RimP n=1 Tax=Reichenbachiella sp. TaxID=2184521 RepID=UPI003265F5D2